MAKRRNGVLESVRKSPGRPRRLDPLSREERSERMSRVRGRDTKPELFVRRLVHGLGFRYRLHDGRLPGHPDMVFPAHRCVIFVHGCMWHRHPGCGRLPKTRLDFWLPKLEGNRRRDLKAQRELRVLGWRVLVLWECDLKDEKLGKRIARFLEKRP